MTSSHTTGSSRAGTPIRARARWRRSITLAVSVIAAAAIFGPATASAGWYDIDDLGNTTPAGHGGAPAPTEENDGASQSLPTVTAAAAIVVDRASGQVLGAKNPDLRWAPASTTKMMTGLLAAEAIAAGDVSLTDTVTIPSYVDIEEPGDAVLTPGDTISLRDLLYMMLVSSKNDAATAVAMHVGSNPDWRPSWIARMEFIDRMNERAAELGLTNTSYVDVSGRDPEDLDHIYEQQGCVGNDFDNPACAHYSTARDLAKLARVVLDDPVLAGIVRTPSWRTTTWQSSTGAARDRTYTTTNQLLPTQPQAYPGAYGVKTGTTHMARENLVSAAATGNNNPVPPPPTDAGVPTPTLPPMSSSARSAQAAGPDVIAVVLGSDDDAATAADRFTDSRALLDFGLERTP
jgi:D-alanyl-D-alanine carboxypeptidase